MKGHIGKVHSVDLYIDGHEKLMSEKKLLTDGKIR